MLEKIIISNSEKDTLIHVVIFLPATIYCISTNAYLLLKAADIQSSVRKNGTKMKSDVIESLTWNSNFWKEAAILCTDEKLCKVFRVRVILLVCWIPIIILTTITTIITIR